MYTLKEHEIYIISSIQQIEKVSIQQLIPENQVTNVSELQFNADLILSELVTCAFTMTIHRTRITLREEGFIVAHCLGE